MQIKQKKLLLLCFIGIAVSILISLMINGTNPSDLWTSGVHTKINNITMMSGLSFDGNLYKTTNKDSQIYIDTSSIPEFRMVAVDAAFVNSPQMSGAIYCMESGVFPTNEQQIVIQWHNGRNIIEVPKRTYSTIRLDMPKEVGATFELKSITVSNKLIMSMLPIPKFIIIALILSLIWCGFSYCMIYTPLILEKLSSAFNKNITCDEELAGGLSFVHDRYYWICTIITILLCYGFTLTNHSIGLDDELLIFNDYPAIDLLRQGRWGYGVLEKLFPLRFFGFLPFWHDLIAILLRTASSIIWIAIFKKYSFGKFNDRAATVFTVFQLSYPHIACTFIFMASNLQGAINGCIVALSSYLILNWLIEKKSIFRAILGALLFAFSISISENSPVILLTGIYAAVFLYLLYARADVCKAKSFWLYTLKLLIICIFSVILWRVLGILIQGVYKSGSYGYTFDSYFKYNMDSLATFEASVFQFLRETINIYLSSNGTFAGALLVIVRVIFLIAVPMLSIMKRRPVIILCGAAIIVSNIALHVFTGNATFPLRTTSGAFAFFIAFVISILYILLHELKKPIVLKTCTAIIILAALFSSLEINKLFYTDYLRYQYDLNIMNKVVNDLPRRGSDKDVVFVGKVSNPNLRITDAIGQSLISFYAEKVDGLNLSISAFFAQHGYVLHSYDINGSVFGSHGFYLHTANLNYDLVSSMPAYPQDGYILETDEYLIVKLGN